MNWLLIGIYQLKSQMVSNILQISTSMLFFRYFEFAGGFESFPNAFYTVLNATILTHSKVQAISQTEDNVTVSYKDWGDHNTLTSITADYVLVTATAKATLLIDFKPPLSAEKMEALRSLHYSSSTKVVLSFSKRFWENDGIRGGKSITDLPSRFIHYPSPNFSGDTRRRCCLGFVHLLWWSCIPTDYKWRGSWSIWYWMTWWRSTERHIRQLYTGGVVKKWGLDPTAMVPLPSSLHSRWKTIVSL